MSLASTQSDIDTALATMMTSIASAQATYFGTYGKYWQGLLSHSTLPADGVTVAADNISGVYPTDQQITWATFGVTPGTIPAAVRVSAYQTPTGHGYTVTKLFLYAGQQYSTVEDAGSGNEDVAWDSSPDDTELPTYSSTQEYFATSASNDSSAGAFLWENPSYVTADDASYSLADNIGDTSDAQYLLAKTFGFSIPSTAVIDGIEVKYYAWADDNNSSNKVTDKTNKLFYSGAAVGSITIPSPATWSTSQEVRTSGSSTSAWGYSGYLTPSIVNHSSFGVGISPTVKDTTGYIDYVKMKVYYTVDATRATPTITSLDVSTGGTAGGTAVTITGTGFKNGATVTFGGTAATSIVIASSTSITCVTPAHSAGAVDVVITNVDAKTVTSSSAFTYAAATPAFVQYDSDTASSSTNLSLTLASAPTSGNLLVLVLRSNSGVDWSGLGAWTQISGGDTGDHVFYKVSAGTETSLSLSDSGAAKADKKEGIYLEISGIGGTPIDTSAVSSNTNVSPSVTTSVDNCLVLSCGSGTNETTDFQTEPSGWTLVGRAVHGATSPLVAVAYKLFPTAGATGTASWDTGTYATSFVWTIAVKP